MRGKFFEHNSALQRVKIEFSYVEDMVWAHCLGKDSSSLKFDMPDEKYFINQEITSTVNPDQIDKKKSLVYFSDVLNTDAREKPLIAVTGGAGVGKTTLCDQLIRLIELQERKKAIYISSSDIVANATGSDVLTVSDLYKISYGEEAEDTDSLLDPTNLEINISCGNIIVIIDGLDEIEAKLKDRFDFDAFIHDAVSLNESYNNCAIVVTSRDYYENKYEDNEFIELLSLYGFDDKQASSYFEKRLPLKTVGKAKKQLEALNISSHGYYPPVILSLIFDILESEEEAKIDWSGNHFNAAKYLDTQKPLDFLVVKLIAREITRQSLKMSVEDVLDVFVQIAGCESGQISKRELDNYLEIYSTDQLGTSFVSFYINPLLRSSPDNEFVGFRYDALLVLLRSRYFIYCIRSESQDFDFIKFALRGFYDGDSDLLLGILANQSLTESEVFAGTKNVLKKLVADHEDYIIEANRRALEQNKKYISAILYYYFGSLPGLTRDERSIKLEELFEGHIQYLFVYGDFYPLDFSNLEIRDSGFYDYENFEKSGFPFNRKVFFATEFKGIAPRANLDAEISIFDNSCELNNRLKHAIEKGEEDKGDLVSLIKNDFITIFTVLYRNRSFVKKSENIFKNKKGKIYPKLSVDDYISFFIGCEVFGRERSHSSNSKYHYFIEDEYKDDIRYLLTNSNFKPSLEKVFKRFIKKEFELDT